MSGGHATTAGILFQSQVAAWLGVHAISEQPVSELGGGLERIPQTLYLETDAPVDDIRIITNGGGNFFINAKTNVTLSTQSKSELASVFEQFVRQWIVCRGGEGIQDWDKPLDPELDRLVLVIGTANTASFYNAIAPVLDRIRKARTIRPRDQIATTDEQRKAYDICVELVQRYWKLHTGQQAQDSDTADLLRLVWVIRLDFDGAAKTLATSLLENCVVKDRKSAFGAWNALCQTCIQLGKQRSGADALQLRESIRENGFSLKERPSYASDIARLERLTERTLTSLARYAHLTVPTNKNPERIEIHRDCVEVICAEATKTSFLVVGEPGAGKSGALYSAAVSLRSAGHPVVVLAVDDWSATSQELLRQELGLDHSPIEVLNAWVSDKPGVLIIDALDASRGNASDKVFHELIASTIEDASGWNVLASIRKFDLRYGVKYQDLFGGTPISPEYIDGNFSNVRHFHIRRLTQKELEQVWRASPVMKGAFDRGSIQFRDLLSSPFNLFLLSKIIPAEGELYDVGGISTQVGLLERYWAHRVEQPSDNNRINRIRLLRSITEAMVVGRQLFVTDADTAEYDGQYLEQLMRSGVLTDHQSAIGRISYSHHMLFDYAAARLIMMNDAKAAIAERLSLSEEHALLLAPAVMIALRIIWEHDFSRQEFWKLSLSIAGAETAGSFSRMLPARIAAELAVRSEDFAPLASYVGDHRPEELKAPLFLIQHVFGTLLANVVPGRPGFGNDADPWCRIARQLSEVAIAKLVWPMKAVIGNWLENPERLTATQKTDLGKCARLLLTQSSIDLQTQNFYDEGAVTSAILGIARTFETAPNESHDALQSLLTASRVSEYGYRELFRFALETSRLVKHDPSLVGTVLKAAYCTPLPSENEVSQIASSRILTLTSNKRQDFEGAQHLLEDKLNEFLHSSPAIAIRAVIDILDCRVALDHSVESETPTLNFEFNDSTARIKEDYSYIWWTPKDQYNRGIEKLLDTVEVTIIEIDKDGNNEDVKAILNEVVSTNIWACLWAVILQVGSQRPASVGVSLLPLLCAPAILDGDSTSYQAGELITAVYPHLSTVDRERVEAAILLLDDNRRDVLLGCIPVDAIVSDEAKWHRESVEDKGEPLRNERPFQLHSEGWSGDGNWWYREAGIDVTKEPHASIHNTIETVRALAVPHGENNAVEYYSTHWRSILALHQLLLSAADLPERLRLQGWDQLADTMERIATVCNSDKDLRRFPEIAEIIFGALSADLLPEPSFDPEREAAFAKSASWGRPAPRVEAAAALMILARATRSPSETLRREILKLVRDPAVEVRHMISSRINVLCDSDPQLMHQLIDVIFDEEKNPGVLMYFLSALHRVLRRIDSSTANKILVLDSRIQSQKLEEKRDLRRQLVTAIVHLWVDGGHSGAQERIQTWLNDPANQYERTQTALGSLREALLIGKIEEPSSRDSIVRVRAIQIFERAVLQAADEFNRLAKVQSRSDAEEEQLRGTFQVLDVAAREIYFGSGAYARSQAKESSDHNSVSSLGVRLRFLDEMEKTLDCLTTVSYPSVTHHLLETFESFLPDAPDVILKFVLKTLQYGGANGGYQFESMGADLLVRLVRRFLADYAPMISATPEFRVGLVKALNLFADAGWGEARQLVYQLPEMLR